ncbi:MAG: DUF2141 domain-containing protein [Pseudomonadota bacterium]
MCMVVWCRWQSAGLVVAGLVVLGAGSAWGSELVVEVSGIEADEGEVGCALHDDPEKFPMESSAANEVWLDAKTTGVQCRFEGLTPGRYAVAISQDFNGNRETDTNWIGMPTEPWGVSNNVRPLLRAPRFDEAAVEVADGEAVRIAVELAE